MLIWQHTPDETSKIPTSERRNFLKGFAFPSCFATWFHWERLRLAGTRASANLIPLVPFGGNSVRTRALSRLVQRVTDGKLRMSGEKHYSCCKSGKWKGLEDTVKISEYLELYFIEIVWKLMSAGMIGSISMGKMICADSNFFRRFQRIS